MIARHRSKMLLAPLAFLALILAPWPGARADLIFDNGFPNNPNFGEISAPANSGWALNLSVSTDTTISNIAVLTNSASASHLTFAIVEFTNFGTTGTTALFESGPESFSADASGVFSFKMSDDFSFTLLAGHTYEIGAISDVTSSFLADTIATSQNGIATIGVSTSLASTAGGPVHDGSRVSGNVEIQLFTPAVVPEPASLVMLGIGMVGVAGYSLGRRLKMPPAAGPSGG
jgi:PEP-CTERM motif